MFTTLKEALEENKRTKNPYLDLGDLGLNGSEIELQELEKFYWITTILFSKEGIIYDNLTDKLDYKRTDNYGTDNFISFPLLYLPKQLNALMLCGTLRNSNLQNMSFLENHHLLESLDVSYNQNLDISVLRNLKNLRMLRLERNQKIVNIDIIQHFTELKFLHINSCQIDFLNFLQNLENLMDLRISTCDNIFLDTKNISTLTSLQKLTELTIVNDYSILEVKLPALTDISFLSNLGRLRCFSLFYGKVTDFTPLQNLINLEEINIALKSNNCNTYQKIILPLQELKNIKSLIIAIDYPTTLDISFIKNMKHLITLDITGAGILDISVLENCDELTFINLRNNQISDISVLKSLKKLVNLNLSENKITNIQALENLTKLEELILYRNQIADIRPIKMLEKIQHSNVSYNPFIPPIWIIKQHYTGQFANYIHLEEPVFSTQICQLLATKYIDNVKLAQQLAKSQNWKDEDFEDYVQYYQVSHFLNQ